MLNFPNTPILNQIFSAVGVEWIWDGVKWKASGSTVGSVVYAIPVSAATLTAVDNQGGYQLEPAGDLTSLNVVMPPTPSDRDEFFLASTTTISGIIASAAAGQSMATGSAGPMTLGAGGRLTWQYLGVPNKWYAQF